eukprot:Tbor_TRINITY_DN5587_c0_g1::TRINITY_DN5587_c0_g1_i3::g.13438::m.13438
MSIMNKACIEEVFNSAPEILTKQEVKEFFSGPSFKHFGTINVKFPSCPTQPGGSSESGLHVLVNAAAFGSGKMPCKTTISYSDLLPIEDERQFFAHLWQLVQKLPDAGLQTSQTDNQTPMKRKKHQTHTMPDASHCTPTTDSQQLKKGRKHHASGVRKPQPQAGNRAVGSAIMEQRSMPLKASEPYYICALQEDNLALNVPVPEQMTCLFGDKTESKHVKLLLGATDSAATLPQPFREALALSTQKGHRRMLRFLRENLPESDAPLDISLVRLMQRFQKEKNWASTTLLTKMAQAQGALRLIFLYRSVRVTVALKDAIEWKLAMKGVAVQVQQLTPLQPKAITEEQVKTAQERTTPQIAALIELAWLLAGRGGDVLQLLTADIKDQGTILTVTFRRGKTARRQQYTVGIPRPSPATMAYLEKQGTWAFPGVRGEDLKKALRAVDPELEQRSLRRGRLLHLAADGWTDVELLELSRHATLGMLRRYLDMGTASSTTAQTGLRAITSQAV